MRRAQHGGPAGSWELADSAGDSNVRIARELSRTPLVAALLAAVAIVLYRPALSSDFTLDDPVVTVRNVSVATGHPDFLRYFRTTLYEGTEFAAQNGDLYRPLSKLSFGLNYSLTGGSSDPFGYHLVNLLLYAVAVVTVLLFLREAFARLRVPGGAANLAAALFCVFPAHVEVVASVKHREELLACIFGFASWLVLMRGGGRSRTAAIAGALFLAALFSKESAILLLPCIVFLEFLLGDRRRAANAAVWGGAAAAVYLGCRYLALGALSAPPGTIRFFGPEENLPVRAAVGAFIFLRYYLLDQLAALGLDPFFSTRLLLLRHGVTAVHALSLVILAGLALLAAWRALRGSVPWVWFLFFIVTSLLTLNLIPIGSAGAFRLMFTPSVFLCAFLATALTVLLRGRAASVLRGAGTAVALAVVAAPVLGYYAWSSRAMQRVWHDDLALFSYSADLSGANPLADFAAGKILELQGNRPAALARYERALGLFEAGASRPRVFDERSLDAFSVVATEVAYAAVDGDPLRAIALSDVAIAQFDRLETLRRGRIDSNAAAPYFVKALAQERLGQMAAAIVTCREGLAVSEHQGLRLLLERLTAA